MQYVRSIGGSVSKTWNSINPATLSGAIDVIVVEQEDGMPTSPSTVSLTKSRKDPWPVRRSTYVSESFRSYDLMKRK